MLPRADPNREASLRYSLNGAVVHFPQIPQLPLQRDGPCKLPLGLSLTPASDFSTLVSSCQLPAGGGKTADNSPSTSGEPFPGTHLQKHTHSRTENHLFTFQTVFPLSLWKTEGMPSVFPLS